MRRLLLGGLVLAMMTAGCSWLLGVSEDPVVVDAPDGDAAAAADGPLE